MSLPSRAAAARTVALWAAVGAGIVAPPTTALGQAVGPSAQPAGAAALQRAREAWENGDFDLAPGLFLDAITQGGLPRADVVDAYVHIGAALVMQQRAQAALAVLRSAATLDPGFKVPPEAGKRVDAVADRARREQARAGSLTIAAQMQDEVEPGAPFGVDVSIAPAKLALVEAVTLEARDTLTAHTWTQSRPLSGRVHFDVPLRLTLPNATIVVVVEARDAHDNQLARIEKRIHVAAPIAPPSPVAAAPIATVRPPHTHDHEETGETQTHKGGFWSSAWPFILGGAVLATGGAAVYFALRPTDDVTVGAARVTVVH
jgi:hypothetical protein